MWTAGLHSAFRLGCVLMFVLLSVSFLLAAEPTTEKRAFVASSDEPVYVAPYMRPIQLQKQKTARVADAKFIGMSALAMGLTIADIESTQHCLGNGTCKELNPLMPHSRAGMYAVNIPINAAAMYLSYRLKASGRKAWWIAPLTITTAHGVGVAFKF
jgi:hypothetical protein